MCIFLPWPLTALPLPDPYTSYIIVKGIPFEQGISDNDTCWCQKGATSYQHFNETLTTSPDLFFSNCYLD